MIEHLKHMAEVRPEGPDREAARWALAEIDGLASSAGKQMQSEQVDQVSKALAAAQGELENPAFDRRNPHFNSRYASEAAIMNAVRPPLSKHGLAISHQTVGGVLRTRLLHGSGQWLGTEWQLNAIGGKPQERGSELTYGRRYNVCGLIGVVGDEDDDANEAQKAETAKITPEQIEHLVILINEDKATLDRLLAYVSKLTKQKIEKLEDIPQSQFPTAFAALSKKVKAATP